MTNTTTEHPTSQERVKQALDEAYDLANDLAHLAASDKDGICKKSTVLAVASAIMESVVWISNEIHNGWIKIEDIPSNQK